MAKLGRMKKPTRKSEVRPDDRAEASGGKPIEHLSCQSGEIVSDIPAHKQAAQAWENSQALYRQVVENTTDLVTVVDSEGRFTFVNRRALSLIGFPPDGFKGQLAVDFVHPGDRERTAKWFARTCAAQETEATIENRLVGLDGNVHDLRWICALQYDTQGQLLSMSSIAHDITELKRAHEALRTSETLLNAVQRVSKVGGWMWEIEQQRMLWTEETYHIHGYRPGAVGTSMEEHLAKSLGLCDEADRPRILAAFRRCVETGEPYDIEYPFTSAVGRRLWVRTSAQAVWDGSRIVRIVGNIIDITERMQDELKLLEWNASLEQRVAERTLELQDREARFRQLADATFEGLAISEAGILLDGNLRLAEIHGFELAEMLGRPVTDFIAPESQVLVCRQIRDGSDTVYECFGLRKDGSVFPTEIHARMGTWMGKATRITALRDLTATKRAAAKLQALQTELEQVQRLALVSEINAGIVHQISQPLSAIGANLSVLIKLKAGDLQRCDALAAVKDVEADVIRMREIVRHLRKLVGQGPRTCTLTHLNTLVLEVLPLLRQKADSRMCRIAVELGNDDAAVHVDAVQLTQVILNLVSNALDASGNCAPERREILITTRRHGDKAVELCVRDAGSGIAPEALNRLFTPFFSTKPDGLGVGLRLSQTIVQAHAGSIEGYNNPDQVGATFRVVMPAH